MYSKGKRPLSSILMFFRLNETVAMIGNAALGTSGFAGTVIYGARFQDKQKS